MKISFLAGGIVEFQHNENVLSLLHPCRHADSLIIKQWEQPKFYCMIIRNMLFTVGILKL